MYKIPIYRKTQLQNKTIVEGESIEIKVRRMMKNKEPIKDGAPLIFTERKDGVMSAYNIRTDRWEIATDAMDYIRRSKEAKRDEINKPKTDPKTDPKTIELKQDGGAVPTPGKAVENQSA